MTVTLGKGTLANLTNLTAARTCLHFPYSPSCFHIARTHLLRLRKVKDALVILRKVAVSALKQSVKTGTLVLVTVRCAIMVAGTMCAASVASLIKPKIEPTALPPSTVNANREQQELAVAASKAQEA